MKPIEFFRSEVKGKGVDPVTKKDRVVVTEVHWTVTKPEGVSLGIRVHKGGIDILGGVPAFDTKQEEQCWHRQIDMAVIAQRLLIQGSPSIPDDGALNALVLSTKDPE